MRKSDADTEPEWNEEIHPDWYHEVPDMRTLILGTYPPIKDRHVEFYYPNIQKNLFWEMLAEATGEMYETLEESKLKKRIKTENRKLTDKEKESIVADRKRLMSTHKVGVQNLGLTIKRKGKSAEDNNIEIKTFQDILGIINRSPSLKTILLTGYSNKTNTHKDFIRYLDQKKIPYTPHNKPPPAGIEFVIDCGRSITCVIGYSTSGRNRSLKSEIVKQFKRALRKR